MAKDINYSIYNYAIVLNNGKYCILTQNERIAYNKLYYTFIGIIDDISKLPKANYAFISNYNPEDNSGTFQIQTVVRPTIPTSNRNVRRNVNNTTVDYLTGDDDPVRATINNDDDELMVLLKTFISAKGITVGDFKRAYGENRKTDMNNDKSRIETKNTLSWNKFKHIIGLFGSTYRLDIEDTIEDNNYGIF